MRGLLTIGAMIGIVLGAHSIEDTGRADVAFIAFLGVIYMLPTFVAFGRRHPGTLMVFVMNLFLGWTFIGWVSAMIQACVPIYKSIPITVTHNHHTGGIAG